jgi:hypothetical protein
MQDIADHGQKVNILLDRETLEAALPQMAMTAVMQMITSRMLGFPEMHGAEKRGPGTIVDAAIRDSTRGAIEDKKGTGYFVWGF